MHLLADWDRTDGFVCDSPNERLKLVQSPTRVVLTIQAYARPLLRGVGCAGVGHTLQPHTIHLASALGTRPLIDGGFNRTRTVLADRSIPNSHTAPPRYVAQPLTWNADSATDRTATRTWVKVAPFGQKLPTLLQLTVGLPTTYFTFNGSTGHLTDTTTINGAPAKIFQSDSGGQTVTTIHWTTTKGQQTTLEAIGTMTDHLTRTQIVTFAHKLAL